MNMYRDYLRVYKLVIAVWTEDLIFYCVFCCLSILECKNDFAPRCQEKNLPYCSNAGFCVSMEWDK